MAFLITFLAGCSTLIGYFFIYFDNRNNNVVISSLGFATGVMFFISLFDLIPESISLLNNSYKTFFSITICLLFLIIGILISYLIDKFLPKNSYNNSSLYKVGIISMLALIIHNIPEGIATFLTSSNNIKLGVNLALAIALHNIPEGISISTPIYYSTGSKKKAFIYTLIAGMSEFLGAILASMFLSDFNNNIFLGCLYSLIAGIMIYISICSLLPTSLNYKNKLLTLLSFLIGIIFIYISIILIK